MKFYKTTASNVPWFLSDGMGFMTQHRRWAASKEDPGYLAVAKKVNASDVTGRRPMTKTADCEGGRSAPAKMMTGWSGREEREEYAGHLKDRVADRGRCARQGKIRGRSSLHPDRRILLRGARFRDSTGGTAGRAGMLVTGMPGSRGCACGDVDADRQVRRAHVYPDPIIDRRQGEDLRRPFLQQGRNDRASAGTCVVAATRRHRFASRRLVGIPIGSYGRSASRPA